MLMVSISPGEASATAQAIARVVICSNSASRSAAGTVFESLSPGMCRSGWRTTAPATTGPARQPRPTSSTPHTRLKPSLRSTFSSVRVADTLVIRRSGTVPAAALLRALAHARGLALQVPQEVELRTAHPGRADHFHFLDDRRVQREYAFHALAERDLAHRKGRPHAASMHPDDDAFEDLNALLVAFAHFHVHFNGISGLHLRPFGHVCLFYDFNRAHGRLPSSCPSTLAGFPA